MSKTIYTTGDQSAPPGTVAWANWQRAAMHNRLKGTTWEAKHLVSQIRAMCQADVPAWHLMATEQGQGFRTFEEFVTTPYPWGLGFADYAKFKAIILSDLKNEREYELMVAGRPLMTKAEAGAQKGKSTRTECACLPRSRKETMLRAIRRAGPFVMGLYRDGLIDPVLAAMLGPAHEALEARREAAALALRAVKAVRRVPDGRAYRKAVNEAAAQALGRKTPTRLDRIKGDFLKLAPPERGRFLAWLNQQNKGER